MLGIAALTAIASFGRQMQKAIQEQSKALLGADLIVSSRDPITEEQNQLLAAIGGEQSREITFPSMIYFLKSDDTRLIQIRALGGNFPFYGAFETIPTTAVEQFRRGSGALVEQNLMDMFDARVGDSIKIGDLTIPIAGILTKVPGQTVAFGTLAPRVYVPLADMEKTGLLKEGSLARYKVSFKLPETINVEEMVDRHRAEMRRLQLSSDTVAERQQDLGRSMDNLLRFLNLIGFIALLLGGVGVASGIHVHMKEKIPTIATLRCLGCTVPQAFAIYFAQAMGLGFAGALVGASLGATIQFFAPVLASDFIPFSLPSGLSWLSLASGIAVGFLICLLFALLPLLPIRRIPPLAALRSAFSHDAVTKRDPLIWMSYGMIGVGLILFGLAQSRRWQEGLGYALGIIVCFGILAAAAWVISKIARLIISPSWPFVWRQGLSNLYRPNNRTVLLMVSLGLGTFLILTLYLVQKNLLQELLPNRSGKEGNTVLFDIQPDQKHAVEELVHAQKLPVLESVPMISMRLQAIKGKTVEHLRADPNSGIKNWVLNREYRSTYRGQTSTTEKLLRGTWHERVENSNAPIPVSMEQGIAENLKVQVGDGVIFDVQGVPVECTVASIREVDWRKLSPNFFVVFPLGAIDDAPAMHVIVTRIESSEQSARLQREVVRQFPNISAVDLTLVLQIIEGVLSKISFVVRFMALFTVGTGALVLAGTIVSGRYQRLRESILLRTIGATRAQVLQILTAEYVFLGALAAITGILLSIGASWALAAFVFKTKFAIYPVPMLFALVAVSLVTLLAGLLGNRVILNRPPLEVLRTES